MTRDDVEKIVNELQNDITITATLRTAALRSAVAALEFVLDYNIDSGLRQLLDDRVAALKEKP